MIIRNVHHFVGTAPITHFPRCRTKMRFSGDRILPFLVVLCLFGLIFGSTSLNNTLKSYKMTPWKKSVIALLFTSNASFFDPELETERNLCRWLKGLKHQRKLCQRKKGLPEILQKTRQLALNTCQMKFQYEQWNCSTKHMKKFFKKMYRETAFMYSLATSAFVYVVAQACVEGKLANCKCAIPTEKPREGEWGGCSVNTKHASSFVQKFLQLKRKGDNPNNVMKYNSLMGLRVTRNEIVEDCKCHGVSGSCTYKICRNILKPFTLVAEDLKQLYHKAVQVEPGNAIRDIQARKKRKQLMFLEPSPNFCDPRGGAMSTVGRRCKDVDNCATLCCSNDFNTVTISVVQEQCACQWRKDTILDLKCENCSRKEILYYCT